MVVRRYTTQYVPAKTSHILHAVLTFFTMGFWFPVWIAVTVYNHNRSVARQIPINVPYGYPAGQAAVYAPQGQYLSALDQSLQQAFPPPSSSAGLPRPVDALNAVEWPHG